MGKNSLENTLATGGPDEKAAEVKMRICRTKLHLYITGCCGIFWTLYGCSVMGPQSIANGRAVYNQVINQTEDQQMLMAVVRNRYGETIREHKPKRTQEIRELLTLLEQPQTMNISEPVVLPVYHSIEEPESGGIAVTTSSIYDLIEIMSAAIDVPEEHRESGLAINYPAPGLAGQEVRIFRAGDRPGNASVVVKYR
jgi:hypothetical protein